MARPAATAPAARRAAALALLLAALPAPAAAPSPVAPSLAVVRGRLVASVDLATAFGPALERRFASGLTNVVAIFVTLVPAEGGDPVAVDGRVVEILYDVWEEAFLVTERDARLQRPVRRAAPDFAALRRLLGEARDLDLGPVDQLPAGPCRLEARVEVNPVSRELMQRTRELLANPAAGRPGGGGRGRSVLGAMASYLLREPDPGEDVWRFRSAPFTPAQVGAR